jgi:uncharacterized membrane protein
MPNTNDMEAPVLSLARMEALSDGIFAVAMTLLVLDLHVPTISGAGPSSALAVALGAQWPAYLAYASSFLTLGIIWANHHAMTRTFRTLDHPLMFLNVLLLMVISFIPFSTEVLARYLLGGDAARTAMLLYSGAMTLMSVSYFSIWWYASRAGLLRATLDAAQLSRITRKHIFLGLAPYAVADAVAFVNVWASLALCILVAVIYALPSATGAHAPRVPTATD